MRRQTKKNTSPNTNANAMERNRRRGECLRFIVFSVVSPAELKSCFRFERLLFAARIYIGLAHVIQRKNAYHSLLSRQQFLGAEETQTLHWNYMRALSVSLTKCLYISHFNRMPTLASGNAWRLAPMPTFNAKPLLNIIICVEIELMQCGMELEVDSENDNQRTERNCVQWTSPIFNQHGA